MDELDQKLLDELERHGFQKAAILAPKLGVGKSTIHRRISSMRRKGVIKVIALPNPVLFGYKAWAIIGIKVEPGSLYDVTRELVEHPSTYMVAFSLSEFDIMVDVLFDTFDKLTFFVSSELMRIKGILRTETILLMCPRKYYNFSWPAPVFRKSNTGWEHYPDAASHNVYQIDETDRRIISILRQDGLTRPAALKARLGIGESTIRKRLKNMLNRGLFSIEVVPNPEVLQYEAWAMMGININHQFAHQVIDTIIRNPAVYFASVSLGRFNVIICARFHNMDLLNHFVKVELPAIKGIASVEPFLYNKLLKYHSIDWSYSLNV